MMKLFGWAILLLLAGVWHNAPAAAPFLEKTDLLWLSTGTGGGGHRPSVTSVIFSDDHGASWQRGEIAVPNTPEFINPNETVAVQLADGRVMLNVRNGK